MDTILGIKTVIAVVETGSFTAAATRLSMSKALVSKYVGQIETQLATRLFNRTTRQLGITQAGQDYYQHALALMQQYEHMLACVTDNHIQPQGKLRISTSVTFGDILLAPLLPAFLATYPKIQLDILLTDKKVDLLAQGIDLAIRIGHLADSSLIAQKINHLPLMLCASPRYLKQVGVPQTVDELANLDCIIDSNHQAAKHWILSDQKGVKHSVLVNGNIAINSPRSVCALAVAGAGIAMLPAFLAAPEIKSNQLVQVLPQYTAPSFGLYAVYPHRQFLSPSVRCFIDFIRAHFAQSNKRPHL